MNTVFTKVPLLKKQQHSSSHPYSPGLEITHNHKLPNIEPDLNRPQNFQHLLGCLCYALAIDDAIPIAPALGMPKELSNQVALSIWVRTELSSMQFLDSSALFNYLVCRLDNLTDHIRGNV